MKKLILFIEDNPEIRENTIEWLELSDFEVLSAADGEEGINIFRNRKPNIVLCDIQMPKLNGYEVLSIIKSEAGIEHTPFIFLTAYSEVKDIQKGLDLGATDYIVKPFELPELDRLLKKYL